MADGLGSRDLFLKERLRRQSGAFSKPRNQESTVHSDLFIITCAEIGAFGGTVGGSITTTHQQLGPIKQVKQGKRNRGKQADVARLCSSDKSIALTTGEPLDPRDRGSNLVLPLLTLKRRFWTRCSRFFLAAVAAYFFQALPAFCQETPAQPSPAPAAVPKQDNPGNQSSGPNNPPGQTTPAPKDAEKSKDDRMFYVMPNYLTVDNQSKVVPLTWKQKFAITAKGSFDPYEFVIVGVVAGIRQADDAYPAFGQGMSGYGQRYGTAFADQVDGNIMVGGVFPSILKTDPRYFRLGKGGTGHRFVYAFSRVLVTRKDSGGSMFNIPEFAGNATAIAISTVYYPAADRSFWNSVNSWGVQMGIDAFGNELKEFWPDIHHYLVRKKNPPPQQ